ncbi:MAG: hemolysin family protein [Vicinamibacterales bacterium]
MTAMVELYVVVGVVLVTSAVCSLFEAVLYSVPVSHIEALERAGRPSGRIFRELRRRVDRPIAAILSLNTVANTGGAAVAGAIATSVWGPSRIVYFSVAFTLAILLFSEMIPKTVGVVYNRPLARVVARPLQWLVTIFAPLIWLSHLATSVVMRRHEEERVSDEDLLLMVRLGLRSGDFKPLEAQVIRNVLALETKTARDVLTPRTVVFALDAGSTAQQAVGSTELGRYSRVPVVDEDPEDVVGIVHRVDILTAVAHDRFDVRMEELMRPVRFVVETSPLDQLLRTFLEHRQHMVVVIDEFGGFEGIVTLEDVLEELLGREIVDESDQVTDLRAYAHRRREELLRRYESSR